MASGKSAKYSSQHFADLVAEAEERESIARVAFQKYDRDGNGGEGTPVVAVGARHFWAGARRVRAAAECALRPDAGAGC